MKPRLIIRCTLIAGACMGPATAVRADPPNPPVIRWSEVTRKGAPRAFMSLQEFATCVVKRAPDRAANFLALDFPSKQADEAARKLASENESCSRNWFLSFTSEFLRGALIEASYHQTLDTAAPAVRLGSSGTGDMGLSPAVAKCVVQRRPELSAELLSTRIASPQQRHIFKKLDPDTQQCARQAKASKLYPELLRYQIADVLYRQRSARMANEAAK